MRVLVACEFSGRVREAFKARGHDAWSCDILPTEIPGQHFQCSVFDVLEQEWDMMVAHPPCTYLCRSGWHWVNKPDCYTLPLKGKPRREAALNAREFFLALLNCNIPRICVENPLPICHVNLPKSSQVIQPWQFGHGEIKATHLWLKNLPMLRPSKIVFGRKPVVHQMQKSKDRSKFRSLTYQGIADAMAIQWDFVNMNDPMFN